MLFFTMLSDPYEIRFIFECGVYSKFLFKFEYISPSSCKIHLPAFQAKTRPTPSDIVNLYKSKFSHTIIFVNFILHKTQFLLYEVLEISH